MHHKNHTKTHSRFTYGPDFSSLKRRTKSFEENTSGDFNFAAIGQCKFNAFVVTHSGKQKIKSFAKLKFYCCDDNCENKSDNCSALLILVVFQERIGFT